jgi:pimeloyl-ACP methyl ester carboxylesterase
MRKLSFRKVDVDGFNIFYREAGPKDAPVLLLLHGFPSASHMFRDLIPQLSDQFRVIAPDLPGFGQSDMPVRTKFSYTFDNIAGVIDRFTEVIGIGRFAIYVFDYGAPTGFRLAMRHPERVTAVISQNGNAYAPSLPRRQHSGSTPTAWPTRPRFLPTDIRSIASISHVPAPMKRSLIFSPTIRPTSRGTRNSRPISASTSRRSWGFGARTIRSFCLWAQRRSSETFPGAEVRFFDTGHFALETHSVEIAAAIRGFLERTLHLQSCNA